MTVPRLESIAITDFRSIRGTIMLPLSAPVVLIHGANGAGKTSVLSALELALTGEVVALRRSDANYFAHLPHRDAMEAQIILRTSDRSVNMTVTSSGPQNPSLFDPVLARFFDERCYLAQSTLGRLLEIYQHADNNNSASPLTRFVKDLLGLDHLEAVIDGLYAADDIRRIRRLVPAFRDIEESKTALDERIEKLKSSLRGLEEQIAVSRGSVSQACSLLPEFVGVGSSLLKPDELIEAILTSDPEERGLISLAGARRTLSSLRADWQLLLASHETGQHILAEDEGRIASEAVRNWRVQAGDRLEAVTERLRSIFPDLPSLSSTDPGTVVSAVDDRTKSELSRCLILLNHDDVAIARSEALQQIIARGRARIATIDAQISELTAEAASGLSQVLAAVLPHVHADECPVCGRDYSEISKVPLAIFVSSRVSQLTEKGDRLQALSKARSETVGAVTAAERERESVSQLRLSQEARVGLKARAADLADSRRNLDALRDIAKSGSAILRKDAEAKGRLSQLKERDKRTAAIRLTLEQLFADLGQSALLETEPVSDALLRLEEQVNIRESNLASMQATRRRSLNDYRALKLLENKLRSVRSEIDQQSLAFVKMKKAFDAAEHIRQDVRKISSAARRTRSEIVSRVFNDSLNAVWRDLFVRLAPTEPFVPAFRLPENSESPIVAALETVHRAGGRGGTPGAMLSAGNLNTAALTLFLALHLSISVRLPWLILDDPVQSMDEVHVSQFAALLRTLSKSHDRQLIIAVHDRALFDYLTLELGPAFPDDQLITLELDRSDSGASLAEPAFHIWEPDQIAAVG